jgi:glycosyltransferase
MRNDFKRKVMYDKKISLITVCFNSDKTIRKTIESVLNQTYSNIEYIIIDGLSQDKTIDIINEYKEKICLFISEKDEGLYYAMNKGISLATGDVIGFINSDDFYASNHVISTIMDKFNNTNIDLLYSDLIFVNRDNPSIHIRHWKSSIYKKYSINLGWMPAHPTFYSKKELFNKYGLFNTRFKIAADYDLMIRFLKNTMTTKTVYIPETLIYMRADGKSNHSYLTHIKANIEAMISLKNNGYKLYFLIVILKPLRKIFQYKILRKISIK